MPFLHTKLLWPNEVVLINKVNLSSHSATWKLPSSPRKKLQQGRSKGKVMVELFFHSSGIVLMEFIPEGVTIYKHPYKKILHRLCNSVRCEHPERWHRNNWLLLHDSVPAHCPLSVISFSFPIWKKKVCGRRFQSAEEMLTASREAVWDFPANIFQQCFQQLYVGRHA
jgi:hypothetical protein